MQGERLRGCCFPTFSIDCIGREYIPVSLGRKVCKIVEPHNGDEILSKARRESPEHKKRVRSTWDAEKVRAISFCYSLYYLPRHFKPQRGISQKSGMPRHFTNRKIQI